MKSDMILTFHAVLRFVVEWVRLGCFDNLWVLGGQVLFNGQEGVKKGKVSQDTVITHTSTPSHTPRSFLSTLIIRIIEEEDRRY